MSEVFETGRAEGVYCSSELIVVSDCHQWVKEVRLMKTLYRSVEQEIAFTAHRLLKGDLPVEFLHDKLKSILPDKDVSRLEQELRREYARN